MTILNLPDVTTFVKREQFTEDKK